MENASKALIIAGAILISILLISIGIMLINSGREVTETGTASMGSYKIQSFNSQFSMYEGNRKGSELKNIFNTVKSSNATDTVHQVSIVGDGITMNSASDIVLTQDYVVTAEYEDGYIKTLKIKKATAVTPAT